MWLVGIALTLTGCAALEFDPEPQPTAEPFADEPAPSVAESQRELAALPVEPRPPYSDDYSRDAFGGRWTDVDGNGCNQRDDVLLRDAVEATTQPQGACDHDVIAGTWLDPYTGAELTFDDLKEQSQAQAIQIDHVVPLAEAWRSGARAWAAPRREEFANNLGNLLAVDGPTNQSKGADDPAAWRPRKEHQCAYAQRWIAVKHQWALAVDASEVAALEEMLGYC